MPRLADLGFNIIEVSSTATSARARHEAGSGVYRVGAQAGLRVFGEVGKKFAEGDTTRKSRRRWTRPKPSALDEGVARRGAERVYWEGHLLRRVMGEVADELLAKPRRRHAAGAAACGGSVGPSGIISSVPLRPVLQPARGGRSG